MFAAGTDATHQALGQRQLQGTGEQEWFDPHIDQARNGADRVIGMQGAQHQVPGQGGTHGNRGGFAVANLPNHDDIGILTQHCAQNRCKIKAQFRPHRGLVDSGQVIFDWIFDGDNITLRLVQMLQSGVKSGGFAAPGRPRRQQHAVGQSQHTPEPFQRFLLHSQVFQGEVQRGWIENTQHDLLTKVGRQGGDPDIHPPALADHTDAAVLRTAFFSDIHSGHNFQPRDQRRLALDRGMVVCLQLSIDPETDAEDLFIAFHVNVAGPKANRF